MEVEAEQEIQEIVGHRERVERRRMELEAQQRLAEKEREDMGVMWGIGTSMWGVATSMWGVATYWLGTIL